MLDHEVGVPACRIELLRERDVLIIVSAIDEVAPE
jgi:hypothetical protein